MNYIYDLNNKDNLNLYFSFKNKHNFSLSKEEETIELNKIKNEIQKIDFYDFIIYPESSSTFLKTIISYFNNGEKIEFKKNNKDEILQKIKILKMSKEEFDSQKNRINNMEIFKINKIKTNKRKEYIPYIFERNLIIYNKDILLKNKKCLIIDDSIFTNTTIDALAYSSGLTMIKFDVFSVFKLV